MSDDLNSASPLLCLSKAVLSGESDINILLYLDERQQVDIYVTISLSCTDLNEYEYL